MSHKCLLPGSIDLHMYVYIYIYICICDMKNSYVRHDSFICLAWLIHKCDMTHSCVRHALFRCEQGTHTRTHANGNQCTSDLISIHELHNHSSNTHIQHAATLCNTQRRCAVTPCKTLQHTAPHCNTLQHTQRQHTATHCNTLSGSTLQHTATHSAAARCNTLQHYPYTMSIGWVSVAR